MEVVEKASQCPVLYSAASMSHSMQQLSCWFGANVIRRPGPRLKKKMYIYINMEYKNLFFPIKIHNVLTLRYFMGKNEVPSLLLLAVFYYYATECL